MKQFWILLAVLLPVWILGGCSDTQTRFPVVNELESVTLTVIEDTIKANGATFVLTNGTTEEIYYRDAYHMERKDERDQWNEFVGTANAQWEDTVIYLAAGESVELPIDWKNLCGGISAGEYRLILEVNEMPVAVEFMRE